MYVDLFLRFVFNKKDTNNTTRKHCENELVTPLDGLDSSRLHNISTLDRVDDIKGE